MEPEKKESSVDDLLDELKKEKRIENKTEVPVRETLRDMKSIRWASNDEVIDAPKSSPRILNPRII